MVALNLTNFKGVVVLISNGVGWVHGIGDALGVEVGPRNVRVVIGGVSSAVLTR